MKQERLVLEIGGISLIAAFYKGGYQGRLTSKLTGELYRVRGDSIEDVQTDLKAKLHSPHIAEKVAEEVIRMHRRRLEEYAEKSGQALSYVKPFKSENARYRNHCWSCKKSVDNLIDLTCGICGWVICSRDGACKCGFKKSQPKLRF